MLSRHHGCRLWSLQEIKTMHMETVNSAGIMHLTMPLEVIAMELLVEMASARQMV
jgi:hypothetical protein